VYLRRPFAPCDFDKDSITLIYLVVGKGTKILSEMLPNTELNILVNLGNGFEIKNNKKVTLISGSVGIAPLLLLAKELKNKKIKFDFVAGFAKKDDVCCIEELKTLCHDAHICTDDGTYGERGNVIDIAKKFNLLNDYYYCCGSSKMLQAVYRNFKEGQLSLECRMGCGFGACMGCSIETKKGNKQICRDGPIFESRDLLW
jgi:dihydroorotate dehydrogenase electron transfer subunit